MSKGEKVTRLNPADVTKDDVHDIVRTARICFAVSFDQDGTFRYRQFEEASATVGDVWATYGYLQAVLRNIQLGIFNE